MREKEDSLFWGRIGLLAVATEDVESHNEFFVAEDRAVNHSGSRLQLTCDGFHVHARAYFPGALRRQPHAVRALIFHGS